jgi:hypothetical protein
VAGKGFAVKRRCISIAILLLVSSPAAALETPEEILACMARNEPRSMVQKIVLRSVDRVGTESRSKATLHWRHHAGGGSDLLMTFSEPEDMQGAALLIEEHGPDQPATMLLYVPGLGRARRVSARGSSGPVLGTNFSFEDFEHLYGIASYGDVERGEDGEIDGRAVHVVEGRPPADSRSAYARVAIAVDVETCVPLRMEFFESADRLRKRMEVDPEKVRSEGSLNVPGSVLMSDLRAETSSELIVESLEVDAEIPSETFEPAWRSK